MSVRIMVKRLLFQTSLLFFASCSLSIASEQFYTKYEVNYTFDSSGQAKIDQKISLTNKQPGMYASAYQMTISGDQPQNISGSDSSGPLKITSDHPDNQTTVVKVGFNDQVVGLNNTLTFHLTYTGRPASHNGQVWEIAMPRLGNLETIDEYTLKLSVPETFGHPAFISPSPISSAGRDYVFTKDQISQVGVVAAFGNFQTFDFSFEYRLDNPSKLEAEAEVAIPADTNYQRIFYKSISPPPTNINVDTEGNWLATFRVAPGRNLTVTATGQVHLLAEPSRTQSGLTDQQRQNFLMPTTYWNGTNSQISALAKQLKTPEAIYNYVVQTLKYDFARAQPGVVRKGGATSLADPASSVCTEFTDLFISLARAAGIPAREVNGYAYTTDKKLRPLTGDVFHSWPQYWNAKQLAWISIDPTWGNTTSGVDYFHKLDFNHFAFITRGLSDSTPAITSENVQVNYGTYKDFPKVVADVNLKLPHFIWPFIKTASKISVTNSSGQALYHLPITLKAQNVLAWFESPEEIDVLPPFSTRAFNLELSGQFWPDFRPKNISVLLGSDVKTYNINASLFLPWQIILAIISATIITTLGWLATKAWGLYLQKRDRNGSLRR